ncbi:MAG TPA: phospholipase A [Burkholderiales bacterium]|nr:phospholipase A [Burkholderiales bacterium]
MKEQSSVKPARFVRRAREESWRRCSDRAFSRRCWAAVLGAGLAAASVAARAQDPAALAQCRDIANDHERLACYDLVSGRAPAAPSTGAPAATAPELQRAEGEKAAVPAAAARKEPSILDAAWGFDAESSRFPISLYHPNYFLLFRYSDRVNNQPFSPVFSAAGTPDQDLDSTEAKFQLSVKARLWTTDDWRWGMWLAYTQQNQWQVYNDEISRPFRETNYMPEVFASYRPEGNFAGFDWKLLNFGFNHQSNGRADPLSRSWNRIFAEVGVERSNLALTLRGWYRVPESADKDDNPDITDYYGYTELNALYRWRGNSFSLMGRGNFSTGKGAVQLAWFSRPILGPLRGYLQIFSGYGESMIDYNWNQTTVGIGVAVNDGP